VVYTPPAVAAPMVHLALEPLAHGRSAADILALRVCDPAIGEGAFLVEVVSVLAGYLVMAWKREAEAAKRATQAGTVGDPAIPAAFPAHRDDWEREARARIAATCIAGVDIDRRAVEAARAATGASASALRVGDALAIDWAAEFPEVFARGGFDVVVANPPYIRQERLGNKRALERFASYDGVADLYVYFVELAHELLRPDGRYCLIVPNKWLTTAYGAPLRSYLAARTSIDGVADLAKAPLFADADAFPCIVWGTATAGRDTPVRAVRALRETPIADVLAHGGELVPRERWRAEPWHLDGGAERVLLERLERAFPQLGERIPGRPCRGVVTGCNRAFVIDRATRDRIVVDEPAAAALIRPFVKGRDIRPWHHADADRFVLLIDRGTSLESLPVVAAHLARFRAALEPRPSTSTGTWGGRKPGSYAWFELQDPVGSLIKTRTPRLLYQDIQTAPACALDRAGEIVPDTTVWMLPTDDRFVLAVLNSPLYGWYAQRRFPPALNGAVRPKLTYLRALPLPLLADADHRAITALVERRLAETTAPDVDAQIATAIADAFALSASERALIAAR
jgi:hypothetical protein